FSWRRSLMQATAAARTPRPSRALRLPSPRRRSPRRFSVSWMTALGLATGVALTLFALLGQMLVDADPDRQDLTARLAKPVFLGGSWDHPFGTDQLGRDIFARMAS